MTVCPICGAVGMGFYSKHVHDETQCRTAWCCRKCHREITPQTPAPVPDVKS